MEKETLRDRFYAITHLTWDAEALINDVKEHGTEEEKNNLLKKITWMIPDGAARDRNPELTARDAAFIEEIADELSGESGGEIWYTSSNNKIVTPYEESSLPKIVSNTYGDGKGVIKFETDVTSIGDYAFQNCATLTSITIPNSVTSIGDEAFHGCSGLTSITIPNSVTSIGERAFWGCSSLTSVTIGNSVTSIENEAFYACSRLTSVTIPNSVTSIGNYAFSGCSSLTSITLPNSVTSIGKSAFKGCSGLTSVTIPNGVTSIGDYAFEDCSSLTSVTIGSGVASIGRSAFKNCSSLTSVTIPNSVTSIGDWAFEGCSSLTSMTIPNSVTSIGEGAFRCSSQTNLTFASQTPVSLYENGIIYMCGREPLVGTITVPIGYEAAYAEHDAGWDYLADHIHGYLREYTVNLTVTKDQMADGNVTISEPKYAPNIAVPIHVQLGQDSELSSLSAATVSGTPITVNKYDDTYYYFTMPSVPVNVYANIRYTGQLPEIYYTTTNGNKILNTFTNSADEHVWDAENNRWILRFSSINDIATIPSNAFYHNEYLSSIVLPEGVETICDGDIEYSAPFKYCTNLTSVTIPNSVTHIGDNAFLYCNSLSSVTIGNGVTSIGYNAFLVNNVGQSAYHVTIPASVTSIRNNAFCGFSNIYLKSTTPISLENSSGYPIRAFSDIYSGSGSGSGAGEPLKIIVPDQAYNDYINAAETDAGWEYYKDVLVAESSMDQNNV